MSGQETAPTKTMVDLIAIFLQKQSKCNYRVVRLANPKAHRGTGEPGKRGFAEVTREALAKTAKPKGGVAAQSMRRKAPKLLADGLFRPPRVGAKLSSVDKVDVVVVVVVGILDGARRSNN